MRLCLEMGAWRSTMNILSERALMVNEGDCVAIFHSIHRVMKAEKLLKAKRLPILLIPAPRALHADCGLAIRYPQAEREPVEACLEAEGVMPEEIFLRSGGEYIKG